MKRQILKYTFFVILLITKSFDSVYSQELKFEHLGIQNGLSQLSVMSVYQDQFGIMWFGTREGLSRYDGFKFHNFHPQKGKNSLPGNIVNSIVGDSNGHLYLICDDKLVIFDLKSEQFTTLQQENILSIYKGKTNLWAVGSDSLFNYSYAEKSLQFYCRLDKNARIKSVFETTDGRLLLGSETGLYLLNKNLSLQNIFSNADVLSINSDSKKNFWIATKGQGLYKMNRNLQLVRNYRTISGNPTSISSDDVRTVCEDKNGTIWIGTYTGLNKYLPQSESFKTYIHNDLYPTSILHSSVYALCCDLQGTIWAGTYYGGVNYFNPDVKVFKFYCPIPQDNRTLNKGIVSRMTEDDKGNIWVGTDGGGVNCLNRKTGVFNALPYTSGLFTNGNVKALHFDRKNGRMFIGSHFGGLDVLDVKSGKTKRFSTQMPAPNQLADNQVYSVAQVGTDVYISTHEQLYRFDLKTDQMSAVAETVLKSKGVWNNPIFVDSKHNLWYYQKYSSVINCTNLLTKKTKRYQLFDPSSKHSSIGITAIIEDSRHQLWFSSNGGGLFVYQPKLDRLKHFGMETSGLLSNYCYALAESKSGNILISTNYGLSRYQYATGLFKNLRLQDGVPLTGINEGNGLFVASDGEVFWGGVNGMVSFYEQEIGKLNQTSKLHFTELEVNNRRVEVGDSTEILENSLLYTEKVQLKSTDAYASIFFATSNFIKENACEYEYLMQGLSDKWIKCSGNKISFSNLSRGEYLLKVRGRYLNSNKISDEISLAIRVNPPFYTSTIALWFYFIALITLLWYWIRFYKNEVALKSSLEFEHKEKLRVEETSKYKTQFFTNISHEFRTPITLIMGQVESMLEVKEAQSFSAKLLSVYKNATKLNRLLTELLDFRKQEDGYLKLQVKHANIVDFVHEIFLTFNDFAFTHKIKFIFECSEKELLLYFDPIQLQKVFNNLLSNAFKFTKPGGTITLSILPSEDNVIISVSDSGIGIPQAELDHIFDSFYQVNKTNVLGTGVGLALAKGIVELHGGKVSVESSAGIGSKFSICLKTGSDHFVDEQVVTTGDAVENPVAELSIKDEPYFQELLEEFTDEENAKCFKMLIVDDNMEIVQLLVAAFEPLYEVEFAMDGKAGLEKAGEIQPDIILTDLMMPIMTGSEMLVKLKSNIETSHIPVVMITANTSDDYLVEGLQYGADDYITKPFNIKHLIIRCNNLVRSRKVLKEKYTNQLTNNLELITHNSLDQEFMEKVMGIVELNIDKEEFTVDILASEMNTGRNKVYSKIKGITGLTPNDFIQNVKLKKAANCLKNNLELSIADIAYRFGFGTPQYFSKCFKKSFGLAPIEYRKEGRLEGA